MRMNKLADAEYWYKESLRAKPDHIPAHLTYGKLLAMTVRAIPTAGTSDSHSDTLKGKGFFFVVFWFFFAKHAAFFFVLFFLVLH